MAKNQHVLTLDRLLGDIQEELFSRKSPYSNPKNEYEVKEYVQELLADIRIAIEAWVVLD